MTHGSRYNKIRSFCLFIMLVLCTLLHGISVAHLYAPAVRKAASLLGVHIK